MSEVGLKRTRQLPGSTLCPGAPLGCHMGDVKNMSGGLFGKSGGNASLALKNPPSLRVGCIRTGAEGGRVSRGRRGEAGEVSYNGVSTGPMIITSHSKMLSSFRPTEKASEGDLFRSAAAGAGQRLSSD